MSSSVSKIAKILSAELEGLDARLIDVEVDVNIGMPAFNIVGLADKALSEAKERINAALKNTRVKAPNRENRRVTVNLAPADVKKTGSQYDIAIALGYLLATGQIKSFPSEKVLCIGELSLNGDIRPVSGVLNVIELARNRGVKAVFIPAQNAREASLITGVKIIPVSSLAELISVIEGSSRPSSLPVFNPEYSSDFSIDLADIKGNSAAKRALIVAAAGGHNLLFSGPPGSGKSMLAEALSSILPPLSLSELIDVTKIYSVAGLTVKNKNLVFHRPFRSPHHTASASAIIGGGQSIRPGEISLAHRGVLFMDEFPEFHRDVLEALRQPLETGTVTIARAKGAICFPARFSLIAAMNPCPCGFYNDPDKACRCSANEVIRYRKKLSGPLLDRMDIELFIPRPKSEALLDKNSESKPSSLNARQIVSLARARQVERFSKLNLNISANSEMSSKVCSLVVPLTKEGQEFIKSAIDKSLLSPRGFYRLLKVARTIADCEDSDQVSLNHLKEAFQYRVKATN